MGSPAPQLSCSVYGFVVMVTACTLLAAYLSWAVVPAWWWADRLGVSYLPDKYWALALPAWTIVAVLCFACCLYPGFIMFTSRPKDDDAARRLLFEDSITRYKHDQDDQDENTNQEDSTAVDEFDIEPLRDLHISQVNRHLYRYRRAAGNARGPSS